ncbi:MAG TPA: conjugal transfer protein TraJ [Azospirillum sp.]|nr:conjugal transfer protein TraJ [Azospirillum sp.]
MTDQLTRRAQPPIKVRPLPAERAALKANADVAGLPLSAYLLAAGLGGTIKSVVDLDHVGDLARINSDLGRLGGLLKLWLTMEERFAPGYPDRAQIAQLLDDLSKTQAALRDSASRIVGLF